jgi:hypothetical protein
MGPARCVTIGPHFHEFIPFFTGRVDDTEALGGQELALGEEVVAVARIEPDFVVTPKVSELFNHRASVFVYNNGI